MKFSAVLLWALVGLVQRISCHYIGGLNPGFKGPVKPDGLGLPGYGPSLGYNSFGPALNPTIAPAASLAASNGGGFPVTSTSPIAPTGLAVLSENLAIDGGVAVGGQLPFLGTVAIDGVFPTAGAGVVSYGCGDGTISILSEGSIAPLATKTPLGTKSAGLGYRGYKPCGLY